MRSLKRPLSVLIAALMLLSVMVIAPVTASATVTASGTINSQGHWVEASNKVSDNYINYYEFNRSELDDIVILVRMNGNNLTEPSWDAKWNQSYDLGLPSDKNWYRLTAYEGDKIAGEWNSTHYGNDGDFSKYAFQINGGGDNSVPNFEDPGAETGPVVWYIWTYHTIAWSIEDGVLTVTGSGDIADYANASDVPWYSNIGSVNSVVIGEGITGIGTNVLAGLYDKPVSLPSTLTSFDNIADYKNANISRAGDDPMSDFAPATFKKLETLGIQERTVDNAAAFRFVTVADSGLLKAADDYGYVVVKTTNTVQQALDNANMLNVTNGTKYSCKGTSNNFAGDYGTSDLTATDYKYISCIVTGAGSGNAVACRFYITLDGSTYYYSTYTNGSTYDGCAYALS